VTSLLWILLHLLDQDEQKKPGLYERVLTLQRSSAWILLIVFSPRSTKPRKSAQCCSRLHPAHVLRKRDSKKSGMRKWENSWWRRMRSVQLAWRI